MSQLRRQMSELNMGGGGGGTPIKRALSSTIGGGPTPNGAPPRTPTSMRKSTFGGATPARALFPDQAKASSGGSNVSIAARVRPLNADKEVHNGVTVRDNAICFQSSSRNAQNGASTPRAQPQNVFLYDAVFGESASQADVFALAEERVLASFVEGYHGTIFTYGQTGSGKTWSMFGSDSDPGLIPRATEFIFRNQPEGFQCRVTLSCLEVYNEEVFDLFGATTVTTTANAIVTSRAKLDIRERVLPNHDREIFVEGLTEEPVGDTETAIALVRRGFVGRHVSATRMNRESSRSHTVVVLTLIAEKDEGRRKVVRTSKLHMIDLAGSERMNAVQTEGDAFVETKKINMSLTTLAKVIEELASNAPRVSFRESKLTYLLSRSLQDAKILLIAAVSPALAHTSESESTLKFANNMKRVRSGARVHESVEEDPAVLRQQIRNLHAEISALQTMMANSATPSGASANAGLMSGAAAAAVEPKSLLSAQDLHELCSEMRGWHTALVDQMETQIATDRSLLHARAFVRYRNRRFRDMVASLSPIDDADKRGAVPRVSTLVAAAASSASPQFLIPDEFPASSSASLTSPTASARMLTTVSGAPGIADEESPKMRRLRKIRALLDSHLHEIDTAGTPDRWTRTGDEDDDENETPYDAAGSHPHSTAAASSHDGTLSVQRTDRSNDRALRQCGKLHGVLLQFYRQFPTAFDRIQHGIDPLEAVAQAAHAREQAVAAHTREQAARRECEALREERAAALVEMQRAKEAAEAERAAIARMREEAEQERAMFKLERLALEREVAAARAELAQSRQGRPATAVDQPHSSASSKPRAADHVAGSGAAHQWAAPRSVHCGSSTPRRVVTAAAATGAAGAAAVSSAIGGNASSARDTPSSRFSTELMVAATTHCALSPLSGSGCSNIASLSNSLVDSMVMLGGMDDDDADEAAAYPNADDDAETDDEATPFGGDEAEISFPNLGNARRKAAAAKKQPPASADAQSESSVVHFHRSASNSNILAAAEATGSKLRQKGHGLTSTAASGSGLAATKSSTKHAPAAEADAAATIVVGSSRAALQRAKSAQQQQSQIQSNTAQTASSAAPPARSAASERPRRQTQQLRESVGSFSLQPGAVVVVSDPSPGNSPYGSSSLASSANPSRANANVSIASDVNVSVSTANARRKSTRNTRQVVIESVDPEMDGESLAETSFLKGFQVDAPGMAPIPAKAADTAITIKPSTVRATSLKLGVPPSPKVAAARSSLMALALAASAGVENAGGAHGNVQSATEPKKQPQRKVSVEAPLAQVPLAGFFVSM